MNTFFYDSFELILFFLVPGSFFGLVYDAIRILRIARTDPQGSVIPALADRFHISRKPKLQAEKRRERLELLLVFMEDLLFCLFVALCELLLFFHLNDGVLRIWGLILSLIGFLLYKASLGRIVLFMAKRIIHALRRVLYFLLSIALTPAFVAVKFGKHILRSIKKRKDVHDT